MKYFLIKYRLTNGTAEDWHAHIARFIAAMTQYLTLWPGDVIWMGTDGTSPDLKPGDVVEIDITGIGTLRNPFVLEAEH